MTVHIDSAVNDVEQPQKPAPATRWQPLELPTGRAVASGLQPSMCLLLGHPLQMQSYCNFYIGQLKLCCPARLEFQQVPGLQLGHGAVQMRRSVL